MPASAALAARSAKPLTVSSFGVMKAAIFRVSSQTRAVRRSTVVVTVLEIFWTAPETVPATSINTWTGRSSCTSVSEGAKVMRRGTVAVAPAAICATTGISAGKSM